MCFINACLNAAALSKCMNVKLNLPVLVDGSLQNRCDVSLAFVQDDVQIPIVSRNLDLVLFDDAI